MDYQLQNIREQLKCLDPQFDNLINQIKSKTSSNVGAQFYDMAVQILNIGVKMFNFGAQNPEMEINAPNLTFQVQSITMQLQNFLNQVNNMNTKMIIPNDNIMMPPNPKMMPPNPMMMPINFCNEGLISNKIEILFHKDIGVNIVIEYDKETTIDEVLKKYLYEVNKPEFIGEQNKIDFLYKAKQIKLGDNRKIKDFFKESGNPKIAVYEKKSFD